MLTIDHLNVHYQVSGGNYHFSWVLFPVAKDVTLSVEHGEFFTLLGPSGCGKTTTLRSVAGLERPSDGRIVIGDQVVYDSSRKLLTPAQDRNIAMVFQSYAVWPHMTVG
ncbi:MAG: ATP-binding cassette domain-containing protein, partial [Rhodospirillaceae bacterium]|nr:ATP-binding cassette domain-containing protein [Rhodospirillaceae bacterium]